MCVGTVEKFCFFLDLRRGAIIISIIGILSSIYLIYDDLETIEGSNELMKELDQEDMMNNAEETMDKVRFNAGIALARFMLHVSVRLSAIALLYFVLVIFGAQFVCIEVNIFLE